MKDFPEYKRVVFDEATIKSRVVELGAQIEKDYEQEPLVVIGVCNGALYFMSDLTRAINRSLEIDTIGFGEITDITSRTGAVKITKNIALDLRDKSVLLIEDVVRTGLTTAYLVSQIEAYGPKKVDICTLLYNPKRLLIPIPIKYYGFEIDNSWLLGYGLDYSEQYRNLPYIVEIEKKQ